MTENHSMTLALNLDIFIKEEKLSIKYENVVGMVNKMEQQ